MTNLQKRILSAVIFGALVLASFLLPMETCVIIFASFGLQILTEAGRMKKLNYEQSGLLFFMGLIFFLGPGVFRLFLPELSWLFPTLILSLHILLAINLFSNSLSPLLRWPYYLILPPYMMGSLACVLVFVWNDVLPVTYGIMLVGIVWCTDITAYFVGRSRGRRRLFPSVSPKKTLEGFFGGWACGLLFAILSLIIFRLDPYYSIAAGVLVPPATALGDLSVSKVKRRAGVKDSGGIMPGHGGLWDRLDGFLVAMPLGAVLLYIFALL